MAEIKNLGIIGYDSIQFVSLNLERSYDFYVNKMDFAVTGRSTPEFEAQHGYKSVVFSARNINIEVIEATAPNSLPEKHLRHLAAGICNVRFLVRDIQHAFDTLDARGATIMSDIQTTTAGESTYKTFQIATPLGQTTYTFVQREGFHAHAPGFAHITDEGGSNKYDFAGIDHLTSNMRTLKPFITWCQEVMGMKEFWRIAFHTSDIDPTRTSGSGLKSIVVWDEESGVKFANNEPARPFFTKSQIELYLEDFGGPGVQHAALGVRDIISAVETLRQNGVEFLHTPANYYDAAPGRMAEQGVAQIDEDYDVLRKHGILIDGADSKYLLQIFMKEAALWYNEPKAGPFFIELIQRKGDRGFGGGNFRALFESIEREQKERI